MFSIFNILSTEEMQGKTGQELEIQFQEKKSLWLSNMTIILKCTLIVPVNSK